MKIVVLAHFLRLGTNAWVADKNSSRFVFSGSKYIRIILVQNFFIHLSTLKNENVEIDLFM